MADENTSVHKKNSTAMSTYDQLIEKGRAEGREEGIEKGKTEVVLNAHTNGLSISLIANITGLEEAAILRILQEHGKA